MMDHSTEVSPAPRGTGQPLRPRARLLRAFGDDLISSETVALTELVKNAYDADATAVLVTFRGPLEQGSGSVEVLDNGHGMSLETIQTTWMEPGTLHRKRATTSEGRGRRVLGEKGIGRFAASRLAERLEVVTRRQGAEEEVHVRFDWSQFDDESRYLADVEAHWWSDSASEISSAGRLGDLARLQGSGTPERGTLLRMWPLRTAWSEEKIRDLRATLARLVLPRSSANESEVDFRIFLGLPEEMQALEGLVEAPEALGKPHYSISGTVDGDGKYSLALNLRGSSETTTIVDKFRLTGNRRPECGPFQIELRVWDRDATSMLELAESHKQSLEDVQGDLNAAAGVSLYRDGFRVLPYGEPRNDWLRLDIRRIQNPTLRVSNNQIVGFVIITADENPKLRDQTNREGLIEGRPYDDLRDLVVRVLVELEKARYGERHPERRPRRGRGGVFSGFDLKDIQGLVRDRHPADRQLLAAVETKQQDLDRRIGEVQEVIARYRRLATLGQLIDRVLHDGRTPLAKVRNESELALRDIEADGPRDIVDRLRKRLALIVDQATVLAAVFRRIEPFGGRKRGRPGRIALEEVVAQAFAVFEPDLAREGIEVELPDTRTEVTADPTELQEVLVNLIDNSIHWLGSVPKGQRRIAVGVTRVEDAVQLDFSDSGPGVDPRYRDEIFEPYFSTKPDGIGLGLALSGEIIQEYYDGELDLMSSGRLPGATFRFKLRRRI